MKTNLSNTRSDTTSFSRLLWSVLLLLGSGVLAFFAVQAKTAKQSSNEQQEPVGFLVSLRYTGKAFSVWQAIQAAQKDNEQWMLLLSVGNDSLKKDLLLIPAENKTPQSLKTKLQQMAPDLQVTVARFSTTPTKEELAQVRKLLNVLDLDAGKVSDNRLSQYLVSVWKKESNYYLDLDHQQPGSGLVSLQIKRLEEHPAYSPDWRKKESSRKTDTAFRSDSIVVVDVVVQNIQEEAPPPPPPPPPVNLDRMRDAQIRRWLQKEIPHKNQDVHISRTAEEVLITFTRNGATDTIRYKRNR